MMSEDNEEYSDWRGSKNMIDRYTKFVLSLIAISLVGIFLQGLVPNALAQLGENCGTVSNPCYVATVVRTGTPVHFR